MNDREIEAETDHGLVTVNEPVKISERVRLPLIQGDSQELINPSPEELDASLWD